MKFVIDIAGLLFQYTLKKLSLPYSKTLSLRVLYFSQILGIFEQGSGTLDLDSAFETLKVHQPHTSLFPPKVTNLPEGSLQYIAV